MQYDSIIIGAGPAGLAAAIGAAENGAKTLLLEKNDSPGKKLLLSGSGRCNITHSGDIADFLPMYFEHARFVKPALFAFTNVDAIEFFTKNGVPVSKTPGGKIFPDSQLAGDVLNCLLDVAKRNGVEFRYSSPVLSLEKNPESGLFEISCENERFEAKNLIIATGGASYPASGSSGDGYAFAVSFGHGITPVVGALTPLLIRHYGFTRCAGISIENAPILLWRDKRKVREYRGDVLFTHRGLSGPGILDFSRYLSRGDIITLSLVDEAEPEKFEKTLLDDLLKSGKKTLKNILLSYGIPERLLGELFLDERIPLDLSASEVDRETRHRIVKKCVRLTFLVDRKGNFNEAMATCGGVSLGEVNRKTMESRLVEGLYFCGEVLDVDGASGGYNIQFALSSGMLAGTSAAERSR